MIDRIVYCVGLATILPLAMIVAVRLWWTAFIELANMLRVWGRLLLCMVYIQSSEFLEWRATDSGKTQERWAAEGGSDRKRNFIVRVARVMFFGK